MTRLPPLRVDLPVAVLRLEESMREVAPFITDEEKMQLGLIAVKLRKAAGMKALLCVLTGKSGPAFEPQKPDPEALDLVIPEGVDDPSGVA